MDNQIAQVRAKFQVQSITHNNPPAADFFQLGKTYYLDFTPVPASVGAGG